jgi:hypothetical protein
VLLLLALFLLLVPPLHLPMVLFPQQLVVNKLLLHLNSQKHHQAQQFKYVFYEHCCTQTHCAPHKTLSVQSNISNWATTGLWSLVLMSRSDSYLQVVIQGQHHDATEEHKRKTC